MATPSSLPGPRRAGPSVVLLRAGGLRLTAPLRPLLSLLLLLLFTPCSVLGISCGQYHPFRKIIQGQNAIPCKWPWQVSLKTHHLYLCGGSLINTEWVLTAAHCVMWNYDYTVELGDIYHNSKNSTTVYVKDIIIHPSYTDLFIIKNDLALIHLQSPVNLSPTIQPICLPPNRFNLKNGTRCWVTGWGLTHRPAEDSDDIYPNRLQEAELYIIEKNLCNKMLAKVLIFTKYIPIISNTMLCAYHPEGKDSCQGDSGGPLACEVGEDTWVQAGIVSWGIGCGNPGLPGIYTKVSSFSTWIFKTINQQNSSLLASSWLMCASMLLFFCVLITL